jgi:hypothetical protein
MLAVLVVFILGTVRPLKDELQHAEAGRLENSVLRVAAEAKIADAVNNSFNMNSGLTTENAQLKKDKADLTTTLSTTSAAKAKTDADLTIATNTIARDASTMGQMETANSQLTAEVKDSRPKLAQLAKELAEVNMVNEQQATKLEQAARAIDRLKEQLVDASKPAAGASSTGIGGVKTLSVGLATAVPTNGKVVDVKSDNGKTYLALSLGERDNIQVGTRFLISRGDKYIGDAIVERVSPDQSVAVVRAGNPFPVQVNDLVSSGQ